MALHLFQIRVNPNEMSLNQLITALRKKMFEKLGRAVCLNFYVLQVHFVNKLKPNIVDGKRE